MKQWNVLQAVVEVISAPDAQTAKNIMDRRLRFAGFEPYEGFTDLLPDNYELAYEDGSSGTFYVTKWEVEDG